MIKKMVLTIGFCLVIGLPMTSSPAQAAYQCCSCDCVYLGSEGFHCLYTSTIGLTECVLFEFSPGVWACRWGGFCSPPPK